MCSSWSGTSRRQTLAALEGLPLRHAVNADYASGMGSSFRTAVEHLPTATPRCSRSPISRSSPADEYRTVLDTYRQQAPAIVSVRYGEVMAPPHLFDARVLPRARQPASTAPARCSSGTPTGRTVLHFPPDLLMDIDTPEDYELAKSRLSSRTGEGSRPSR